jgi:hypothetical protein
VTRLWPQIVYAATLGAVLWSLLSGWSLGSVVVGIGAGLVVLAATLAIWPGYFRVLRSRPSRGFTQAELAAGRRAVARLLLVYLATWLTVLPFAWLLSDHRLGRAMVLLAPALILVVGYAALTVRERRASG